MLESDFDNIDEYVKKFDFRLAASQTNEKEKKKKKQRFSLAGRSSIANILDFDKIVQEQKEMEDNSVKIAIIKGSISDRTQILMMRTIKQTI